MHHAMTGKSCVTSGDDVKVNAQPHANEYDDSARQKRPETITHSDTQNSVSKPLKSRLTSR
jgi:hypothetical protein